MSEERVRKFLNGIGLAEYCSVFAENDISYDLLGDLSAADLQELGISNQQAQQRFLSAAQQPDAFLSDVDPGLPNAPSPSTDTATEPSTTPVEPDVAFTLSAKEPEAEAVTEGASDSAGFSMSAKAPSEPQEDSEPAFSIGSKQPVPEPAPPPNMELYKKAEPAAVNPPPPATPPVQERTEDVTVPIQPQPSSSGKGVKWFVLGVAATAMIGLFAVWVVQQAKEQESAEIQEALWADLKLYKTDADENRKGMPNGSLERARKAYDLHPTPDSAALVALAAVWESGWHFGKARWKARKFERDDEFTKLAMEGDARPAAILARAWLTSNACVLLKSERSSASAQSGRLCDEAKETYARARAALAGKKDLEWLYFESLWTEVRFINRHIEQVLETDSPDSQSLDRLETLCDAGREKLKAGPVNDVELALQCTKAAAIRKDWTGYISWVQTQLELGADKDTPSSRAVGSAFWSASADCKDFETSKRHRLKHRVPIPYNNTGEANDFCTLIGYAALGCSEFGVDIWDKQSPSSTSKYDWKGMMSAIRTASTSLYANNTKCVYSEELHSPSQLISALDRVSDRMNPTTPSYYRSTSTGSDVCAQRNSKGYPTKCVPCCDKYFGGTETCYLLCGTYY